MNVLDHKIDTINKVVIDFGVVDDEEYKVLCSTSFSYQGRACLGNFKYTEIESKAKKPKAVRFTRERRGAEFEFPHQSFIDAWMKELPTYFKG